MSKKGRQALVHVITGPGKGKTTAAFGMALRALGQGFRVCIVQFMKTGEATGEVLASKRLPGLTVRQFGTGNFIDSKNWTDADRSCATDAIRFVRKELESGNCDVLVLDEVNPAVYFGLLDANDVLSLIDSKKGQVEIVLTGRNAPKEFIDRADYVSFIEEAKHPFKTGTLARKGIEW
jgi:cob(I)alamin adenosyltransferase